MKIITIILTLLSNFCIAQSWHKYSVGKITVSFPHKPSVGYFDAARKNVMVRDTNLYSTFILKYDSLKQKVSKDDTRKAEKIVNDYLTDFIISMNGYIDKRTTFTLSKTTIQELKCRFRKGNVIIAGKTWIFVNENRIFQITNYYAPNTDRDVLPDQNKFFKSITIKE